MEYPIKAEKYRAMNSYNKSNFLYDLILHSITALTCSLICSYPYWFPSLCCSMKHFLLISLPNISAFFVNPKCLFIVVNVIVVFLVGESRLVGSNSSPVDEIRDQYVERSRGLRGHYSTALQLQEIKEEGSTSEVHDNGECQVLLEQKEERKFTDQDGVNMVEDKEVLKKEEEGEEEEEEEEEVVHAEGDEEEEEEEAGLPAEELKKRAEEFIARVNKQMWLEP